MSEKRKANIDTTYFTTKLVKNTKYILFVFTLLLGNLIIGQTNYKGMFGNSTGECIRIENDTISFKLYNNDAFGTYIIGKGLIKSIKSKIVIKELLPIIDLTTSLTKESINENGIKINVLDNNGDPFEYANIRIKDTKLGKSI